MELSILRALESQEVKTGQTAGGSGWGMAGAGLGALRQLVADD